MSVLSNSVWPHRRQPTRLRSPWDSPGKNTGCHFLLQCMKVKVKLFSHVWLSNLWTAAYQAPPSTGFFRQEYWSGLPLPSPVWDGCSISNAYQLIQLFLGNSAGKESACSAEDPGSVPGLGRSPGERNGKPLQYPCLENPIYRGVLLAAIHGITKSQAQLRN